MTGDGITEKAVLEALSGVQEPELHRDLVTLNMVRNVRIDGARVALDVQLTTPACPLTGKIRVDVEEALYAIGVQSVDLNFTSQVMGDRRIHDRLNLDVANTIAVASGKGGVGKSTVAANLAVALGQMGARVGLLDADIYGPNIPIMMGVRGRPRVRNGKAIPLEAHGLRLMSMGFLVAEDTPVIWRGPMLHGALRQFLGDVDWGQLDYLIIDLPPGTGDVHMSLAQSVPLTGGVLVTTPQAVALADVRKGAAMFQKLEVPILGVVENMSYFTCPDCGQVHEIFSRGGGRTLAETLEVPFLGEVPLDTAVRDSGDAGVPIVIAEPQSPAGRAFTAVAQQLAASISVTNFERVQAALG